MIRAGIGPEPDPRSPVVLPSSPAHQAHQAHQARRAGLLCAGIAAGNVVALIGDLCSPVLLPRQPMVVVLLSPRTAYMVAMAHEVPFALFVAVAVVRLCAVDPLHFLLGRTSGPAALATARRVGFLRRILDRLPPAGPLWMAGIVGSPTAKMMCAAGAAGLPPRGVAAANVAGTTARVLIIWTAGRAVPGAGAAMASLAPWLATGGCLALVTATVVRRLWRPDVLAGRGGWYRHLPRAGRTLHAWAAPVGAARRHRVV